MKAILVVCSLILTAAATPAKDPNEVPSASPEELDALLHEERYDEFNFLMGIDFPHLTGPLNGTMNNPEIDTGLPTGDILISAKQAEEARQGILFTKYGGSKWKNGVVPYSISNSFSRNERNAINRGISDWNAKVRCLKFNPRRSEEAYVLFTRGNGCYSYLGRTGKQQPISIGEGCTRHGTILHEMMHAAGYAHEQNRYDRDDNIRILWQNIPERWKSQYEKTSAKDYGLQGPYDFYSAMHYGIPAPETGKAAFEVLDGSVDKWRIGQREGFTQNDVNKINELYC